MFDKAKKLDLSTVFSNTLSEYPVIISESQTGFDIIRVSDNEHIGTYSKDNGLSLLNSNESPQKEIRASYNELQHGVEMFNQATPFPDTAEYSGVQNYRMCMQLNGVVLGITYDSYHDLFMYASWERAYKSGLVYGHYAMNYNQAIKDFAERSGITKILESENKLENEVVDVEIDEYDLEL